MVHLCDSTARIDRRRQSRETDEPTSPSLFDNFDLLLFSMFESPPFDLASRLLRAPPASHRRRLAKSRAVERFERFSPRATAATAAPSTARARDARRGRHGGDARGRRRRRGAAARALGGGRTQKPRRRGRAAARGDREGARATVRPRRAGDDDDGDERCANDTNARLCDAGR